MKIAFDPGRKGERKTLVLERKRKKKREGKLKENDIRSSLI